MIVMVSNQTGLEVGYLAGQHPGRIGHLYSPGGQRGPWPFMPYALDNGAWPTCCHGAALAAWGNGGASQFNDLRKFLRETQGAQERAA